LAFGIMDISSSLIEKQAVEEIAKCNEYTSRYGLTLSHRDAVELFETRTFALKSNGRIEFAGGIIDKIIRGFCDSPFLSMHNYCETLHELIEIFYFYKNETLDLLSDDDLLEFMKISFDSTCQGSLELLAGRELANMARNLRCGYHPDYVEFLLNVKDDDSEY